MPAVIRDDGSVNNAAIALLHAVSGVDAELIRAARIRPSRSNWLRAPWYRHHRGGAITVGRTIWFTRIWWLQNGRGDGSLASTWHWLLLLAHEVGTFRRPNILAGTFSERRATWRLLLGNTARARC
jgi:hypothetical protein